MKNKIGFKFSVVTLISISIVTLGYHILIITGVIPFEIVWGGKLETREQMLQFESVSIFINLFILVVVLIKGNYLKINIPLKLINILCWFFATLFALNTLGNIFAESIWEAVIFTPITLLSSILFWRLAIEK